jgi:hypothetical protein
MRKLNIEDGPWEIAELETIHGDFQLQVISQGDPYCVLALLGSYKSQAQLRRGRYANDHAILITDAGNTYHATQMLPSEMAERIKALEEAVQAILNEYDEEEMKIHTPIGYFKHFDRLRALLPPPIDEAHGHLLTNPE